jgi:DNA-binding MarR family transcriptional regulator
MRSDLLMIKMLIGVYWFDEALQSALRAAGWPMVTRAQSLLFANISAGEHRPARLAKNLGVSRQSMSQMLSELEARGLLIIEKDPDDARAQVVKFTAHPLREAAHSVLTSLEDELRRRIGAQKYAALSAALSEDWGPEPIVRLVARPPGQAG